MSIYLIIILLIVVLDFSWTQYLAYRNRKRMSPNIPMQLAGIYNEEEYARQQAYQKENSLFGLYTSIFPLSFYWVFYLLVFLGGLTNICDSILATE